MLIEFIELEINTYIKQKSNMLTSIVLYVITKINRLL